MRASTVKKAKKVANKAKPRRRAIERAKHSMAVNGDLPPGRPTLYTPELADLLCFRIGSGWTLLQIEGDPAMPNKATILEWVARSHFGDPKYKGFAARYAYARDLYFDHEAQETLEISDTERDPQRAKVRVQARQWIASHRISRYRDSVEVYDPKPTEAPPKIKTPAEASRHLEDVLGAGLNKPLKKKSPYGRR